MWLAYIVSDEETISTQLYFLGPMDAVSVVTYVLILTSLRVCLEDMIAFDEAYLLKRSCRITTLSGDSREISFLFQRVSVLVQRFNSVLLRESFTADSRPDDDL